jgi:L-seryl-tRNA(Ser) seleniumtransferase
VDKLTIAALEATLALCLDEATALRRVPVLRMLSEPVEHLQPRADAIASRLAAAGVPAEAEPSVVVVGGGALPDASIPSRAVVIRHERARALEHALRTGEPPLVGRLAEDALWLDVRTLDPAEDDAAADAVIRAWTQAPA